MSELDKNIIKFIQKMHLLSLAINIKNQPYAASCFYAFNKAECALLIASSSQSAHIQALNAQDMVAGTIALDTNIIGRIRGIQFRGKIDKASKNSQNLYFKKFPYALAMKPEIWQISLEWIKFTNNTLGFGKKIIWQRDG